MRWHGGRTIYSLRPRLGGNSWATQLWSLRWHWRSQWWKTAHGQGRRYLVTIWDKSVRGCQLCSAMIHQTHSGPQHSGFGPWAFGRFPSIPFLQRDNIILELSTIMVIDWNLRTTCIMMMVPSTQYPGLTRKATWFANRAKNCGAAFDVFVIFRRRLSGISLSKRRLIY